MNQTDDITLEEQWKNASSMALLISIWLYVFARTIMAVSSAAVFIEIVFMRKRYEFPYIFVPLCFLVSGLLGSVLEIYILKLHNEGSQDVVKEMALPLAIHYMFYTTGHQLFASQYL